MLEGLHLNRRLSKDLTDDGRTVTARAFPISIDAHSYAELARSPRIQERAKQIRRDLGNPPVAALTASTL